MLKTFALAACLAVLSGCASSPATAPDKSTAAAAVKPPPGCVAQTATRLKVKDNQCAGFGSSYTEKDMLQTGQMDVGQALQMLDPSVQVRH